MIRLRRRNFAPNESLFLDHTYEHVHQIESGGAALTKSILLLCEKLVAKLRGLFARKHF